jgi:uncharacterized membrane protein
MTTPASVDDASGREDPGNGTERILAFSDGVFAIAITLLILDIGLPRVKHGLLSALGKQWPAYLSYALSFLIVGIVWSNHHRIFRLIARSDHTFLIINVVFLLWVAFIPFPTALLSEYLLTSEASTAMAIYAATFLAGAMLFNLLWRYAAGRSRLLHAKADRRAVDRINRGFWFGPLLYLVDFVVSLRFAWIGLVLFIALAAYYALDPYFDASRQSRT